MMNQISLSRDWIEHTPLVSFFLFLLQRRSSPFDFLCSLKNEPTVFNHFLFEIT